MADNQRRINKARYWNAVVYPENMVDGWQDEAPEILQIPFAYCIHDKDKAEKENRKVHVHILLAFSNTTTYKHVLSIVELLSAPGRSCVNKVEACIDVRHSYDYLIHDTDNSRKKGKHQYSQDERILCNNFDIGAYEQVSAQDKQEALQVICDYVIERDFLDLKEFYQAFKVDFPDSLYFQVYTSHNAMIDRMIRGNYNNHERLKKSKPRCIVCGTTRDVEIHDAPDGQPVCICKKDLNTMQKLFFEQCEVGYYD